MKRVKLKPLPRPRPVAPPPKKKQPAPVTLALPAQRLFVGWLAALALAIAFAGVACAGNEPPPRDVCEQANALIARCGTTVPELKDTPCTGLVRLVSRCVADHASGCDDLAALMHNPDRCFPDAGDGTDPEELPVPSSPSDGGQTQ